MKSKIGEKNRYIKTSLYNYINLAGPKDPIEQIFVKVRRVLL